MLFKRLPVARARSSAINSAIISVVGSWCARSVQALALLSFRHHLYHRQPAVADAVIVGFANFSL